MPAYVASACRTAVVPRDGALGRIEPEEMADTVVRAVLANAGVAPEEVDDVVLGNALYAGGNPARVAALKTGLPTEIPAITIDTQCCSGLDAVIQAAIQVGSGEADAVVAGGVESFSRAPIRQRRPKLPDEAPQTYDRPPFTPWPDRDPDMIAAAATLARELRITRAAQEAFAIESHRRAIAARGQDEEIVVLKGACRDSFARRLSTGICRRLPVLPGGDSVYGCTAATVAVEADAAAAVLVVSERRLTSIRAGGRPMRILGGTRRGGDPTCPALAPIAATHAVLRRFGIAADRLTVAEIMEAFAVQAMACIDGIGLDPAIVNRGGGALARGHPIGASGAILMVRLWHELQNEPAGAVGLATIAAAGGLGSALLVES